MHQAVDQQSHWIKGAGQRVALKFVLTPQNYSQNVLPGKGEGVLLKQNQLKINKVPFPRAGACTFQVALGLCTWAFVDLTDSCNKDENIQMPDSFRWGHILS